MQGWFAYFQHPCGSTFRSIDVKIEHIRSDLARDLKDFEYRVIIKLGTMMEVAVGAMATLVKPLQFGVDQRNARRSTVASGGRVGSGWG